MPWLVKNQSQLRVPPTPCTALLPAMGNCRPEEPTALLLPAAGLPMIMYQGSSYKASFEVLMVVMASSMLLRSTVTLPALSSRTRFDEDTGPVTSAASPSAAAGAIVSPSLADCRLRQARRPSHQTPQSSRSTPAATRAQIRASCRNCTPSSRNAISATRPRVPSTRLSVRNCQSRAMVYSQVG